MRSLAVMDATRRLHLPQVVLTCLLVNACSDRQNDDAADTSRFAPTEACATQQTLSTSGWGTARTSDGRLEFKIPRGTVYADRNAETELWDLPGGGTLGYGVDTPEFLRPRSPGSCLQTIGGVVARVRVGYGVGADGRGFYMRAVIPLTHSLSADVLGVVADSTDSNVIATIIASMTIVH